MAPIAKMAHVETIAQNREERTCALHGSVAARVLLSALCAGSYRVDAESRDLPSGLLQVARQAQVLHARRPGELRSVHVANLSQSVDAEGEVPLSPCQQCIDLSLCLGAGGLSSSALRFEGSGALVFSQTHCLRAEFL